MKYFTRVASVFSIFMLFFCTAYPQQYNDQLSPSSLEQYIQFAGFNRSEGARSNFIAIIAEAVRNADDKNASVEFLINKHIIRQKEVSPRQALADYIYNMYIITALSDRGMPHKLNIGHIGAADSLDNRNENWKEIYEKEKEFISNTLNMTFKKRLGIASGRSISASVYEIFFLYTLMRSKNAGVILYGGISELKERGPLPEAVKNGIRYQMELNRRKNDELVAVYKQVDVAAAIEQKGTMHIDFEHHPVSMECGPNTHYFCKNYLFDTSFPKTYGGWKITEVYSIKAFPGHGPTLQEAPPLLHARAEIKTLNSGKRSSPYSGKQERIQSDTFDSGYGEWTYHEAPLLVLTKGNDIVYVIADPFLFNEPVTLNIWTNVFRQDTFYSLDIAKLPIPRKKMVFHRDSIPDKGTLIKMSW
ncbi:MAG: hypothetical protein LBL61_04400 [Elusimicrobiota bacterium]|nr:hypothetical protein [Elusimicrobiota bacterium]